MSTEKTQNQLANFDQVVALAKSPKELFELTPVQERFIKNFEAQTGRKDGENRLAQEKYAYLEMLHEKPELRGAPMWSHFSAILKAATTGLSWRNKRLYAQPIKKDGVITGIKVDPSPAGRREMLEMMRTVEEAPEAQVVCKGDIFIWDKLNQLIIKHEMTEKSVQPDKLENVLYSYQRIKFKSGKIKDVVVTYDALVKAKSKSKIKGDGGVWEFVEEACKKTATNRAFDRYHKYNDYVVLLDGDEANETDEENDKITSHEDVTGIPDVSATVDTDTGEVKTEPKQEPKVEEAKIVSTPDKKKQQMNLLDD